MNKEQEQEAHAYNCAIFVLYQTAYDWIEDRQKAIKSMEKLKQLKFDFDILEYYAKEQGFPCFQEVIEFAFVFKKAGITPTEIVDKYIIPKKVDKLFKKLGKFIEKDTK